MNVDEFLAQKPTLPDILEYIEAEAQKQAEIKKCGNAT